MSMKFNKLRKILNENGSSVATRMWSTNPFFTELLGQNGNFDYMEFVAEYSPYTLQDLQNICRAAELNEMGTMIKVDFQNRGFVAQKAVGSGFQAIMFADHRTPDEVRETVRMMKSETPASAGMFGYPNNRFIGGQSHISQMDHAKRVDDIVLCFMIEKKEAMDHIDEICSIPGVDMVQFGPSDYCMSCGLNRDQCVDEFKAAERKMIETALKHGVQPRCEIPNAEAAQYYIDLGVRHFCVGDQVNALRTFWNTQGPKLREIADKL